MAVKLVSEERPKVTEIKSIDYYLFVHFGQKSKKQFKL